MKQTHQKNTFTNINQHCDTYLFVCLIRGLLFAVVGLLLLSVTDLLGGCGGGPRFLELISLLVFDACCCCGFICFFSINVRDNSVLKSTTEPFVLLVLVFCGLLPIDADDGDSTVGEVTPIANSFEWTFISMLDFICDNCFFLLLLLSVRLI